MARMMVFAARSLACAVCVGISACGGGSFTSTQNAGGAGAAAANSGGSTTGGSGNAGASGTGGRVVSGGPIPLDQYESAVAQALCPPLSGCCSRFGITLTTAQCETTVSGLSGNYAAADPTKYTYDAVAAGNCVALAGAAISSSQCTTGQKLADPLCSNVFTGLVSPGQPCNDKIECAHLADDTVTCEALTSGTSKVCVVERRVALAKPCYWTCTEQPGGLRTCGSSGATATAIQGRCFTNDGLYCGTNNLCVAQGDLGAACPSSNACAVGYCDIPTGLCSTPVSKGGACTADDGCADGLYCAAHICSPQLAPGSPCQLSDQCNNGTCQNGACVAKASVSSEQLGVALLCAVVSSGK